MLSQRLRMRGLMVLLLTVTAPQALAADKPPAYSEWVCPAMIVIAVIGMVIMVLRGPDGSWFFLYGDKDRPLSLRLLRCGFLLLLLVALVASRPLVAQMVIRWSSFTDLLMAGAGIYIITRALFALHPSHGGSG